MSTNSLNSSLPPPSSVPPPPPAPTHPPQLQPLTEVLSSSLAAFVPWQKSLSSQKFKQLTKGQKAAKRFEDQKALVSSSLTNSEEYLQVVSKQLGIALDDEVLKPVPSLHTRVTPSECAYPTYETDKALHEAFLSANCRREATSKWAFWHLVTLKAIAENKVPNPPEFLLRKNYTGEFSVNRAVLTYTNETVDFEGRKDLDNTIRNLLRHSGGIYHRKSSYLSDAALPGSWWRLEMATKAAKTDCGLSEREIHKALLATWKDWGRKAAYSATKLADPNVVAAYAMAYHEHSQRFGEIPKGDAANLLIAKLMRRTIHLCVSRMSPKELAEVAS